MRTLQILALALLATAARADIQPCQLTFLGTGVVCTEGILMLSLLSNAPPDTIVEPIPGGLALVGQMDGSNGGTSMVLTVTVPTSWAIVGLIEVAEAGDVLAVPDNFGIFGIMSVLMGFTETGVPTQWQNDSIDAFYINQPCPGCVSPTSFFGLTDAPPVFDAASTVILSTETYNVGGLVAVHSLSIGGFDAVSPEPSTMLLLGTVALVVLLLVKQRGTA